ncbi:MAG: diguanylate cyclase [Pseudomonadota bacterium]
MSAHRTSRRIIVYGFLLVVAVLLAITGAGLYRIHNLSSGLTEVIQERDVQIDLMHTIQKVARERSILLQSMMISRDPFLIDDYAMDMSAEAARYIAAREELLTHAIAEEELRLLERQHAQSVETATSQNTIINHLRNEEHEPAAELLFYTTLPGQRRAMAMMDEFISLKRQQNLEILKATDLKIQHTYSLMLLLSGLGVLFSIAIAMLINHRISNEINRRLETESDLRHSELRERTIRENIIDGLLTLDIQGNILSCNKAGEAIFGYDQQSLIGKNAHKLMPQAISNPGDGDLSRHLEIWEKRMLGTGTEIMGRRSTGESFPAEIDLSKIELDGDIVYIVVIRDISEKKEAQHKLRQFNQELEKRVIKRTEQLARSNEKLRHEIHERVKAQQEMTYLATHDNLTGLPNRSLFNEHLDIVLNNSGRHGRTAALLFIDLDGFKAINDTYGHEAGDSLLQEISNRMRASVRQEDIVARMGGDEFTVLLGELTDSSDATLVAQKLIEHINKPVNVNSCICHVGASIGIAMFPHSTKDADTLLRLADDAMYIAKSMGKNTYHIHQEGSVAQQQADS